MATIRKLISAAFSFALVLSGNAAVAQTVEYIHTDALGSVVAVTDANRAVIERSEYEPYGSLVNRPVQDGPGYAGHVSDATTGLSYMQQRYYDPALGRFLSTDPVAANANSGSVFNRYWYADANPYRFVDPDGRAACAKEPSGTCVDSPRTETGKTPQSGPTAEQQKVDAQVRVASRTDRLSDGTELVLSGEKEQGFGVSADGTRSVDLSEQICMKCSDGSKRTVGTFNLSKLKSDESGGHTHNSGLDPLPGPEDGGMARVTGKTAYQISQRGAFAIERTDVGYRVRLVEGQRLTPEERRAIRETVDAWNQNQGGSGVSCKAGC